MRAVVLALDQGTTSTRAIAFRAPELVPLAVAQRELPQHFPAPGLVEHDPEDIWRDAVAVLRQAAADAGAAAADIAALGIADQRETALLWDRRTGAALHRAIVW
ncbi:MAG: glycerol kinase, partial [Alphaproteobacteria bacterium]|nr:glycerol kinase [Alphaproteobacteria bacterium]